MTPADLTIAWLLIWGAFPGALLALSLIVAEIVLGGVKR